MMSPPAGIAPPASLRMAPLRMLTVRSQFLAMNRALRVPAGAFLLQARDRGDDNVAIGIGFTCSKKVGNAVARNRAKRRLREVARLTLPALGLAGWDYVLIGRPAMTAARDFVLLLDDLHAALAKAHPTMAAQGRS